MKKNIVIILMVFISFINVSGVNSFHIFNTSYTSDKMVIINSLNEFNIPIIKNDGFVIQLNLFDVINDFRYINVNTGYKINVKNTNISLMLGYDNYNTYKGVLELTKFINY